MNFGTVGSASQREAHFALFNYNPVPISIEDWGTNFTGAVVELLGVAEGNESTVESRQNFSNMNMSVSFLQVLNILETLLSYIFHHLQVFTKGKKEKTTSTY